MAISDLTIEDGSEYKVVNYHPYRLSDGSRNPNVDSDSRSIMNLKDPSHLKHEAAKRLFRLKLSSGINGAYGAVDKLQVAIAPSSAAGKRSVAMESIVEGIECNCELIYKPDFLVRIQSIPPAHTGGPRSKELHLRTIAVHAEINPQIPMILLDDVSTTGATLHACSDLLRRAGAKHLIMIAMGQTTRNE